MNPSNSIRGEPVLVVLADQMKKSDKRVRVVTDEISIRITFQSVGSRRNRETVKIKAYLSVGIYEADCAACQGGAERFWVGAVLSLEFGFYPNANLKTYS